MKIVNAETLRQNDAGVDEIELGQLMDPPMNVDSPSNTDLCDSFLLQHGT